MSKVRIGITIVVLATLLSSAALARVRLGIGPLGVATSAVARVLSLGGLHHVRAFARHGQIRTASLRSQDLHNATDDSGLGNPAVRRQIAAAAALAGWHGGHIADGWWRHGDGGYGWVGPLSGHSPSTISTTTRSGVTVSASGTTAILTSMPRSLRLTAMMRLTGSRRPRRADKGKPD